MRTTIFQRPAVYLCTAELEGVQSEGFGSGEAVRARRGASQAFFEELGYRRGPSGGMVTPRGSRGPQPLFLERTGAQIPGEERIEAAAGQAELLGGLCRRQSEQPEGSQHMPDEGRCVAIR